ncbi:MAG: hypothetical protein PWQ49_1232 [Methanohalophilus sp.]|nr:hypothetical protein [Methanohalophilus sp.]
MNWRKSPLRFIPTCVGNSAPSCPAPIASAVHPHVCGELFRIGGYILVSHTVHPHVCGELVNKSVFDLCDNGSSPRVWGTPVHQIDNTHALRFIPTCVGNSVPLTPLAFGAMVHPHVCGELSKQTFGDISGIGSSPRVWGTLGLIMIWIFCVTVHPHVCGELYGRCQRVIRWCGSSPRVWGTPHFFNADSYVDRFIPTCVGNSQYTRSTTPTYCGSSPRVWGTRYCVGNPA